MPETKPTKLLNRTSCETKAVPLTSGASSRRLLQGLHPEETRDSSAWFCSRTVQPTRSNVNMNFLDLIEHFPVYVEFDSASLQKFSVVFIKLIFFSLVSTPPFMPGGRGQRRVFMGAGPHYLTPLNFHLMSDDFKSF